MHMYRLAFESVKTYTRFSRFSLFFYPAYTALQHCGHDLRAPLVYTALLGYFITLVLPLSPVPGFPKPRAEDWTRRVYL